MKRLPLIAVLFALSCFATAQRLPELAVPESYKLTLTPNFDKDNFTGDETIRIRVLKTTSQIVLNATEINFQDVTIASSSTKQKANNRLDKEKEMATLVVDKPLQPGTATIEARYTGILNNELRGFYLGKEGNGKKYAVTQFEATDARRAFPSFDEPAYKATFTLIATIDKSDTAISNGKIVSDSPAPEGKHTIRFATTPKMSTYLVALAVGNFEYIEGQANGIPIRVWTTPGKKQLGKFALETAEYCIQYFD